jgi:YVTN family beta-propeller protein
VAGLFVSCYPFNTLKSPIPLMKSITLVTLLLCAACAPSGRAPSAVAADSLGVEQRRLPTGVRLDPAGTQSDLRAAMPLGMVPAPGGRSIVVSSAGYRAPGLDVIDRSTGAITQSLVQHSTFLGVVFSADGGTLYASGADQDVVYLYRWADERATLADSIVLAPKAPKAHGTRYSAGLALSPDGQRLYVAEHVADSLAVVDLASKRVIARFPTEHLPYAVAASSDGRVYVSNWDARTVSVFKDSAGTVYDRGRIIAGRHPSALLLNHAGTRLYVACASTDRVAVVDTRSRRVLTELLDPPPAGPGEGSTPNALALSPDETRLFVAEADANAVAVYDLMAETSDVATAQGDDHLAGRVPVGWYPTSVLAVGDSLFVGNGKGRGTVANPQGPQPIVTKERKGLSDAQYTLALLRATLTRAAVVHATKDELAAFTTRVSRANGWDAAPSATTRYPPIEHVLYVIKENRTYDQVLSDIRQGDGDTSLIFFGRAITPNIHALAERFGLFDRFFVNSEVSNDGHDWTTAAYVTDYREKTTPPDYAHKRNAHDVSDEGEDATEPAGGYIWNLAQRAGITYRNYGEFLEPDKNDSTRYVTGKPYLATHSHPAYPGFDMKIPDQRRADLWLAEFKTYEEKGELPQLETIWLPRDHTAGARVGYNTPRAMAADNDYAVGRIVEAISHSRFWGSTAIFVLQDDAQDGPDHVDSHRSPLLVISPWAAGGVIHRFANTTAVLKTIEELLHLESMSQFDHYSHALRDIWRDHPDLTPYVAISPTVDLAEMNPDTGKQARASSRFNLREADAIDDATFNHVLWAIEKGEDVPYPPRRQADALTLGFGSE